MGFPHIIISIYKNNLGELPNKYFQTLTHEYIVLIDRLYLYGLYNYLDLALLLVRSQSLTISKSLIFPQSNLSEYAKYGYYVKELTEL